MDSFNKVVSFVLGLVVVIVFFAFVTGKLKLPGNLKPPFAKTTLTPTPVSTVKINGQAETGAEGSVLGNNYKAQIQAKPGSIPSTGIPTLFIPSLLAGGLGGFFLRKTGNK